ncbi:unnamed protein product [Linum tenue]|uniref:Uncharacterized protein n=1 Tax=Linum tenue TaxID=586396 RepID=A0AAV0RNQ6_9ROSI|nr:unnamed protein product [Linum tenue]
MNLPSGSCIARFRCVCKLWNNRLSYPGSIYNVLFTPNINLTGDSEIAQILIKGAEVGVDAASAAASNLSVGSFLREGLNGYWDLAKDEDESRKSVEEAIFAMMENCQRNDTSACDLRTLDFNAEREYRMFPGAGWRSGLKSFRN